MGCITYRPKKFSPAHQDIIAKADGICREYAGSGLSLTLRQLYYQFVARGYIANRQSEYKRLGDILNDARMAGELDWDYLVDRTRNLASLPHWKNPTDLIKQAAKQYRTDQWKNQKHRIEVWIEKDAGIGVIESVCQANDVPFFSCRGYTSVSELWSAAQRIGGYLRNGERVTIIHIGDHDPSGLDMTRDIGDRLRTFVHGDWLSDHYVESSRDDGRLTRGDIYDSMREAIGVEGNYAPWRVKRIALTYEQVQQYDPPPNPAKTTDARFERYVAETGLDESWELDALDPFVLQNLIQAEIDAVRDEEAWGDVQEALERDRRLLAAVAENWDEIRDSLDIELPGEEDDDADGE